MVSLEMQKTSVPQTNTHRVLVLGDRLLQHELVRHVGEGALHEARVGEVLLWREDEVFAADGDETCGRNMREEKNTT